MPSQRTSCRDHNVSMYLALEAWKSRILKWTIGTSQALASNLTNQHLILVSSTFYGYLQLFSNRKFTLQPYNLESLHSINELLRLKPSDSFCDVDLDVMLARHQSDPRSWRTGILHSHFACNGQDFEYVIASQWPRIVHSERTKASATQLDHEKDLIVP